MPPRKVSQPSKRRRTTAGGAQSFGAPSEADSPSAQTDFPSSSTPSTRTLSSTTVPSLTTLCVRIFASNLQGLSRNEHVWKPTLHWLKIMPENVVSRIFAMLRDSCPELLSHTFIVANFLRGHSLTLTGDLPGVKSHTISSIDVIGSTLRELKLSNFHKISDTLFASLLSKLPSLQLLVLSGCSKVASKTVQAAAKSCPLLTTVNLNYTAVLPVSLIPLITACTHLAVLKLAGIPNWTDASFAKLLFGIGQDKDFKLTHLRTLKLRQTSLSDASLHAIIALCPNLRRLDVSFTAIRHPPPITSGISTLEKLSLTSTQVSGPDILTVISQLSNLKALALGALGGGQGSSAAISNSSAMTMDDETLSALTDILKDFTQLETISLNGNSKLAFTGRRDGAISKFVRCVGRKCKRLNLAGIQGLHSADLSGLLRNNLEENESSLEELILSNTSVDDQASPYISTCPNLRILQVAGTKFTSAGIFLIIDACTKLDYLDLTSCRGIKVTDRRRFFEVWKEEWRDK